MKPEEGRIIHQELRGRRKPKGWMKDEIAAMKQQTTTKAQRKKRKR
jgi:hypothetical protein